MPQKTKKVSLIIPCHNEALGLPDLMKDMPYKKLNSLGYKLDVLVIDNNSKDNTSKVAKKLGARVVFEPVQGKGKAIKKGFDSITKDTDFVVMLDGDNTYKPYELDRLLEPLNNNFSDVIIGSRLEGSIKGNSMKFSHRFANWFFTFITRKFYGANVTDTCTGYFAWKKEVVDKLNGHIQSKGFAIEAEMISKMAKMGYRVHSVPITYDRRNGSSKLAPLSDGLKITWMLLKNINWKPEKSHKDTQYKY